jgi:hypothetical protein
MSLFGDFIYKGRDSLGEAITVARRLLDSCPEFF